MAENAKELSLQKNMAWNSIGSLIYLGCSWLTTVLVVTLSTDYADSGSLAVAMAVGNLVASISLFKVRPVQVSVSDNSFSTGDFVGLRIVTSLFALIFVLIYSFVTVAPGNYGVVALYALFKVAESFVDVFHGVFQKHNRLDYAGKSQIIRGVLLLVSFVIGLSFFRSLATSILLMAMSSLMAILLYDRGIALSYGSISPRFNGPVLSSLIRKCFAGFASSLLITMVVSVARQSYGICFGNEELGHYAAVATPCVIIQALASYIYAPLYGKIADADKSGDDTSVGRLVAKVLSAIVLITGLCLFASFLLGDFALEIIYGSSIAPYVYLIYGALVSTACAAMISFLLDVLIILGKTKAILFFSMVSILLCFGGIRFLGADPNSISLLIAVSYLVSIVPLATKLIAG